MPGTISPSRRGPTVSLKLPKNPSARISILLILLSAPENLTEPNPLKNAKLLCDALMMSIDRSVLIGLRSELVKKFPEN
jgi:hypothetical protein